MTDTQALHAPTTRTTARRKTHGTRLFVAKARQHDRIHIAEYKAHFRGTSGLDTDKIFIILAHSHIPGKNSIIAPQRGPSPRTRLLFGLPLTSHQQTATCQELACTVALC